MAESAGSISGKCRVCSAENVLSGKLHAENHALFQKCNRLMNLCQACLPIEKAKLGASLSAGRVAAAAGKANGGRAGEGGGGSGGGGAPKVRKKKRSRPPSTLEGKCKAVATDLQVAFANSLKENSLSPSDVTLVYYLSGIQGEKNST